MNVDFDAQSSAKVFCQLCQSTFEKFESFGLVPRENARCQNCGSLERRRLLWEYLNQKIDLMRPKRKLKLLHFAPEKGFYNLFMNNKKIDYFPCDIDPLRYHGQGMEKLTQVDICNIPFKRGTFDIVLCNHVLEHIPDDRKAMRELCRVMKNNAWAILQVPIKSGKKSTYEDFSIQSPEERTKAFGRHDHVRVYGRDYKERLEEAGFLVNIDTFVKKFSSEEIFKYGLRTAEDIFLCTKKAKSNFMMKYLQFF